MFIHLIDGDYSYVMSYFIVSRLHDKKNKYIVTCGTHCYNLSYAMQVVIVRDKKRQQCADRHVFTTHKHVSLLHLNLYNTGGQR